MSNQPSLLAAATVVEARKITASRVVHAATILLIAGVALLASTLHLAAGAGNEQILAQLGPYAETDGWERLLGITAQIVAIGCLLGFGTVVSWSVGREFTDGTISGLFALPVPRPFIAAAKLMVFAVWTVLVAVLLVASVVVLGVITGAGSIGWQTAGGLARLFVLVILTGLLSYPAAWAATLGRNLLPGIATAIGIGVLAQVAVVAGTGAWLPVAAPALWASMPQAVSLTQLALVAVIPVVFGALTLSTWARLQLDR
ncbi:ABC transporter permease subunit [Nocardia uniformis]|uniref:ABC transporter permease subunit n=1 Tax=Nocardia uniformis TaxID=53432 RepID=A0A849CJ30_9NOCA|nr:ABC transporter permease [Nocardia uniformis]NNH74141.1 ABC transporter permease subunit [Nocardia uniformis]